jgi:flavin reductase (DIM6/NTAB) family NADH-FMN oxidoreductase RutF
MHVTVEPGILYFGTPVVLISTVNEDGSFNLAPMSSAFWLGWRCVLGLAATSKTPENMLRTGECVLNLPCAALAGMVDQLALTTGSDPVPEAKVRRGYRYEPDKFGISGFTAMPSETVHAPRIRECPVQLEAVVEAVHGLAQGDPVLRGRTNVIEVRIQRVHVDETILLDGEPNRIDPDKWRPLILSFQEFYGLGPKAHSSRLGTIPEALYRGPDIERSRTNATAIAAE